MPEPSHVSTTGTITPRELAERLKAGTAPRIIDVREPHEHAYARIPGAQLVPLATLDAARQGWDPDEEIVVHCHSGVRSLAAARHLRQSGFTRVANLAGGISRWSEEVDPSVPRY